MGFFDRLLGKTESREAAAQNALVVALTNELHRRAPGSPFVAMSAPEALQIVADAGYSGLIINPAGRRVEISRADVERLLS